MSIDRSRREFNAEDLLARLSFEDLPLHGIDPQAELTGCLNAVSSVWDHEEHINYTDHGVPHSLNVIHNFLKLDEIYEWSQYEKLAFSIGALIHDIGMQYNYWAGLPILHDTRYIYDVLGTESPPLTEDTVRAKHVEHGVALIKAEFDQTRLWASPPAFCTGSDRARTLLYHAFLIAFAHSGSQLWQRLRDPNDANYRTHRLPGGSQFRPRLLAGTLRVCDELDGNFTRVTRPDRLWADSMPDQSRLHWLSCYYVVNSELTVIEKVANTELIWRVPEEADMEVRNAIRSVLAEMRDRRITRTVAEVNEVYDQAHDARFHLPMLVGGLDKPPQTFPQNVNKQLVEILTNYPEHLRRIEGAARSAMIEASRPRPGEDVPLLRFPIPLDQDDAPLPLESSTEELLKEWFWRNRIGKHVELASGVHTDVLLHCRALVSDQRLVDRLTAHIAHEYANQDVATVIGVGTSAITLAVNVAYRLGASFTFTFFSPKANGLSGSADSSHYPVEVRPVIDPTRTGKVLILDDVISTGNTSREVVEDITNRGVDTSRIIYYALFRLGDMKLPTIKGVVYEYICHIPDVYYAINRTSCELCERDVPFEHEWDAL